METLNQFFASFENLSVSAMLLIFLAVAIVWFLPAMIAAVLNPAHVKYIAVACIPAGFSIIAWSGLMLWACTGKVFDKYKDKVSASNTQ